MPRPFWPNVVVFAPADESSDLCIRAVSAAGVESERCCVVQTPDEAERLIGGDRVQHVVMDVIEGDILGTIVFVLRMKVRNPRLKAIWFSAIMRDIGIEPPFDGRIPARGIIDGLDPFARLAAAVQGFIAKS